MTLPQTFQIGDQVRMRRTANGLIWGLSGTVVRVLAATDCCDVQFEGYPWPRLVYGHDIKLIERARTLGQS